MKSSTFQIHPCMSPSIWLIHFSSVTSATEKSTRNSNTFLAQQELKELQQWVTVMFTLSFRQLHLKSTMFFYKKLGYNYLFTVQLVRWFLSILKKKNKKIVLSRKYLFIWKVPFISTVEMMMLTNTSTNIKEEKCLMVCYKLSELSSTLN